MLTTAGLLVAAGLRPTTRLSAKSIFRGPETPTREARAANAALAEAGELLNGGDGEAAVHAARRSPRSVATTPPSPS